MNQKDKIPLLIRIGPQKSSPHPRHIYPPMDLKYIQSALTLILKKSIPLIDNWVLNIRGLENLEKKILSYRPGIVVIKAATPCIEEGIMLAEALQKSGILTIAIGQQVSHIAAVPDARWIHSFDLPVLGEPEEILPQLVEELLKGGDPPGISRRYHSFFQAGTAFSVTMPDNLVKPLFSRQEFKDYAFPFPLPGRKCGSWGYVLTAWGCPHQCEYCSGVIRKTRGAETRYRTPAYVVSEIEELLKKGAEGIVFEDDSFLTNRSHFLSICNEILNRKLHFPWIAHVRCDEMDEYLARKAKEAGAVLFKVGIESGSPKVIEALGKAPSGKKWLVQAADTFNLLHTYKIGSVALFIIGSPEEKISDIKESVKLAGALNADYVQVQIFTLYPDTMLYSRQKTRLGSLNFNNSWHYKKPVWTPGVISRHELLSEQKNFYKNFYLRKNFILTHLRRCWLFYFTGLSSVKNLMYLISWIKQANRKER